MSSQVQVLAYLIYWTDTGLALEESTGRRAVATTCPDALEWLSAENEHTCHVFWNLDQDIAPLLQLLSWDICKELAARKECILDAYRLFYIPGKLFSITNRRTGYFAEYYHLSQFLPGLPSPDTTNPKPYLTELQHRGRLVIRILNQLNFYTNRLVSPVNIFEKQVIDRLNIPTHRDIPAEVCKAAYRCANRQWLDAHAIGYWNTAYDYDLSSAYPTQMTRLIDTRYCTWREVTSPLPPNTYPPNAIYGFFNTEMSIPRSPTVHPFLISDLKRLIAPTGTLPPEWHTLHKLQFARNPLPINGRPCHPPLADFRILQGYYCTPDRPNLATLDIAYPLQLVIPHLISKRTQSDAVRDLIVKRMAAGFWGKLGATKTHQKTSWEILDDHCNPVWFCQVPDQISIEVSRLCLRHKVQPLHISLDGLLLEQPITLTKSDEQLGWKQTYHGPALIMSTGRLYLNKKRPGGLHLTEALSLIKSQPSAFYWPYHLPRTLTLKESIERGNLKYLTEPITTNASIHLLATHKRHFPTLPHSGTDLLSTHYYSVPFHFYRNHQ